MRTLKDLMNLEGRVAVITGGAGHIGSALADGLAELGARIVVIDSAKDRADEMALDLQSRRAVPCLSLAIDLGIEDQIRSIPEAVIGFAGRLDILIHCAAYAGTTNLKGWVTPFEEQSYETFNAALRVNLAAPFLLSQICAPHLRASGHGSIINVSSIYGIVGPDMGLYAGTQMGNPAGYGASKGGLIQFTRWLSTVLAPDIRVNCLSPGGVARGQHEDFIKRYIGKTPLKRMATEEDLKGAAAYLASDLSSYVTGQNLVVDGGWTAW